MISKKDIIHMLIATIIGAAISFLTHILQVYTGIDNTGAAQAVSGAGATATYLGVHYKNLV